MYFVWASPGTYGHLEDDSYDGDDLALSSSKLFLSQVSASATALGMLSVMATYFAMDTELSLSVHNHTICNVCVEAWLLNVAFISEKSNFY